MDYHHIIIINDHNHHSNSFILPQQIYFSSLPVLPLLHRSQIHQRVHGRISCMLPSWQVTPKSSLVFSRSIYLHY